VDAAIAEKIGLVVEVFNYREESEVVDVTAMDRDGNSILESRRTIQPVDQTPLRTGDRISCRTRSTRPANTSWLSPFGVEKLNAGISV
jgi:hypothetical protein